MLIGKTDCRDIYGDCLGYLLNFFNNKTCHRITWSSYTQTQGRVLGLKNLPPQGKGRERPKKETGHSRLVIN